MMAMTVNDLLLELNNLEAEGHGDKYVKYVGSCEGCGAEIGEEIETAEFGGSEFPDEVWIS